MIECDGFAQQLFFHHITKENGLVSNRISSICQDKKGYMWIGTQTGLQRYDGSRFVTYVSDQHDSTALQTDWISTIFEDSKERLWIGTDRGAPCILDRATGVFKSIDQNIGNNNEKLRGIWAFLEDKNGEIWLSCRSGIFKFNENTHRFESKNKLFGLKDDKSYVLGATLDSAGNFWCTTPDGLKELEFKTQQLFDKNNNPNHLPIFNLKENPVTIKFDKKNNLWIGTSYAGKLYKYDFQHNNLQYYSFKRLDAHNATPAFQFLEALGGIFVTSSNKVIVSLLSRGIAIYDEVKNAFVLEEANDGIPYKLHPANGDGAFVFTEDREKNIWIGSTEGINLYNPTNQHFVTFSLNVDASIDFLTIRPVSGFLQNSSGDIFVSYYCLNGGIVQLDKDLKFKHRYLYRGEGDLSLGANEIWGLFDDGNGNIWAPNQDGDILRLETKTGKITLQKDSVLHGNILAMQKDAQNNIWIGHWNKGLIKIDGQTKKATSYKNYVNPQVNGFRRGICMLQDDNKIWIGTFENGLQLFDKDASKFVASFVRDKNNKQSISNNTVMDIFPYNKDTLILATEGGINIFDKHTKAFKAITSKDGLPNNLALAITVDDEHNLWAAFEGGFCKINMRNYVITNYGVDDGIIENSFNNNFYRLKDGRLMVGSAKSFIVFDPKAVTNSGTPPDVTITGFKVFGKTVYIDSLIKLEKPVTLSYNENSIQIEFASIYFNSSNKIKYYYQLEGIDKEWFAADYENVVYYHQLPPGNFTLKLKCCNRDGVFCKHITTLHIKIVPPFWKTSWFRFLLIALFILSIYLFIKWREKNIKILEKGKTNLQQLVAEKYKIQFQAEQISNFFSTSLLNKNDIDDVLWDVAKNLIGKLGFVDCIIYLWNEDKTKLVQKAGYGPKGSLEEITKQPFDVALGQGIVGYVAKYKQAVLVEDTTKDDRYRKDELIRRSEICVPIISNDVLIGVIDSEHPEKGFFTKSHLQLLTTIADMVAIKINVLESEKALRQKKNELVSINQQLAEVQLTALRSQMNPHFIFNALNSIKTFVMENDAANAEKYLDKFAKLIRFILDTTQSNMVLLSKEIELLTLYLDLEQLRFSDKLTYSITVDKNIHIPSIMIPSMLIQPFVENAVLHGILHKENDGHIAIQFTLHNTWLEIIIEDNGVGREKSKMYNKSKPAHHSLSMEITNKRLRGLNKNNDAPIGITITDLKNDKLEDVGTRVSINVPI